MEGGDREKKLAAGKEKLAAFRKKRAKKKKKDGGDDSLTQSVDTTQNSFSGLEVSGLANVSSLSDLHSFTAESDQYSLTSGDEWSAEESDYQSAAHYQAKLAAATQRIAELEEAVEGKQLALDKMVVEMQMGDPSSHKIKVGMLSEEERQNSFRGSVPELQDALLQRDKIIRQLTGHLQETAEVKANGVDTDPVDYAQETQRLSQQVACLQQQLTQAGETVEQQVAMCQMSVQALQDAKSQILALQGKVTEKNKLLEQLSSTLTTRTSEVVALQHRETQLEQLVQTFQQQTLDSGSDSLKAVQSATSRIVALEQELDRLGEEHAQSLKSVSELQQQLTVSKTAHQALVGEKELAMQKITGLEEELDQLALARDDALKKMSDLELQVQEGSVFLQAESDRRVVEANERIIQLEGEILELNEKHRLQVSQLNERTCQLEHSLTESTGSSQTDMQDLKNVINSQQGELLTLHKQLMCKEDELSASKEQVGSLCKQLEALQKNYTDQQNEAAVAINSFQQQLKELKDENTCYKQQMVHVRDQICSFQQSLQCLPPSVYSVMSQEAGNLANDSSDVDEESDVVSQIQKLQASYIHLSRQYSETLEKSQYVQAEVQTFSQSVSDSENINKEHKNTIDDMASKVAQLQSEVTKWIATVQEKDMEFDQLNSKFQSILEEKQLLTLKVEQHEQATEQQTLQSDTLQRRMESRVNSVLSEVTEYKEALKESEQANMELQDKLDMSSRETDSLKLQLAASEDLMKHLQSQLNADDARLSQTEIELQTALQDRKTVTQLQSQLQEKDSSLLHLQSQLQEKDSSLLHLQSQFQEMNSSLSQLQTQLQEKDSSLSQLEKQLQEKVSSLSQLQSQLQEEDSSLSQLQSQLQEKDSCLSQLQEKLQEKDSSLLQLQAELLEKDRTLSQLEEELQGIESSDLQRREQAEEKTRTVKELSEQLDKKEKNLSQLQEQVEDKTRTLSELQSDIAEREKTISHLQEQLEMKNQQFEITLKNSETASEDAKLQHARLSEDIECVRQQLTETVQQHQAVLAEREVLIISHQEQVLRIEESLEQTCSKVKCALQEKEQAEMLLAHAKDSQAKEIAEIRTELDKKSKDFEDVQSEKEKLLMELTSLKSDKDNDNERNISQLEEHTKKLQLVTAEKEQLLSTLHSVRDENSQRLKDMQQKLDHSSEEYQTLLHEKEELTSQQSAVTKMQTDLVDQLQVKEHECEIVLTENEKLREELQSCSSVYMKENRCLKLNILQQNQKFEILVSNLDNLQDELLSRESESSHQLRKTQQKLKENVKELEDLKNELKNVNDTAKSKDTTIESLHAEADRLKEQLMLVETSGAELSQDRQQTIESLQNHVHQLEQELVSIKEEKEVISSRLADQADMFKVKEEEMVGENNILNHQLEEVRNDAQETIHQLQKELADVQEQLKTSAACLECQQEEVVKLKMELEISRTTLQTQDNEISSLKEEGSQQRDNLDSLKVLNAALSQEKTKLLVRIEVLESNVEEVQKVSDEGVKALQSEIDQLVEEKRHQLSEFDKERTMLADQNNSMQEQLDSLTTEIEGLQTMLKSTTVELDRLKMDNNRLQQQHDTLQLDFSSQIEHAQSDLATKDAELQTIRVQLTDSNDQLTQQLESLQEELASAQSESVQKDSTLSSVKEELTAAKLQLERLREEKDLLKSNFDCCMEDMTQRAAEKDTTIQQLQWRLVEASQNVDRDQGQLREMYESQLSELEDRLAAADLETQRLEKICENANTEKEKLKENYNGRVAELELTAQAAESELSHLKEQMSKMSVTHEKDIADLKHSSEIQLSSVEENCQSLEKALAKQDSLMQDVSNKYGRDRAEREKAHDQQLSEAYEQARMCEMDIGRLKRQLDEMRKDHQKELLEVQKTMETQVFDLENKCVVATSELERLRQTLWGMEQDHSGEMRSLQNKIQELEALSHSQEKQIADLQDRLIQSSHLSDDSIVSMKESYLADLAHLEEVNQQLRKDVDNFRSQIKSIQKTHVQEMEALKREHRQDVTVIQEKCQRAEKYSHVLQSHLDSAAPAAKDPEHFILEEEIKRLQQELAAAESNIAHMKQRSKESEMTWQTKVAKLQAEVDTFISEKQKKDSSIEILTEDLKNKKHCLQELQKICQNLEQKNKQLSVESPQARSSEEVESRFVLSEEDRSVNELQQQTEHHTEQLQHIQTGTVMSPNNDSVSKDKKGVRFGAEGSFEPEPDSLEYLDLAGGAKETGDYFVEESEPSKSPKIRTKSVPSEMCFDVENEHSLSVSKAEPNRSSPDKDSDSLYQDGKDVAGRFEPEEECEGTVTCTERGRHEYPNELKSESVVDGFQPESVPVSPDTHFPTATSNPSFLPHPICALPSTRAKVKSVEMINSCSQTESVQLDGSALPTEVHPVNLNQLQTMSDASEPVEDKSVSGESKTYVEAEVARKLQSLQEQLEEQWVQKMRSQEVELEHIYNKKFEEFKRQTEHQCQQHIQHMKQDTQASFVDAVRKMRKGLEKKQKQEQKETQMRIKKRLTERSSKRDPEMQEDHDDESLGDIVKQLHKENQELAEVRDVLLEQIAKSQTRGRHHTVQHELQAVVAGGSQLSPHSTQIFSAESHPASEYSDSTEVTDVHQEQFEASESLPVYSSNVDDDETYGGAPSVAENDSVSQYIATAGSEDEDDQSEGSCVRERFLEELEEMSQQSGHDLPLEWELTSAAVSHIGGSGGAGVFERDQTGSGSVWEVFDGRCLRHDCREVRHRYNNLFHWLSRVCNIPSTPIPTHSGEGNFDTQGDSEQEGGHRESNQGEGWVSSEAQEFDSLFMSKLLGDKEAAVEALLCNRGSFSSELEQEDRDSIHLSEAELLSRLLSTETEKINLEERLTSRQHLFNHERRELQQRGDVLQARCDELKTDNLALSQQLVDMEHKCMIIQESEVKESENKIDDLSEESLCKTPVQTGTDHLLAEKVPSSCDMFDSSEETGSHLLEEKKLLTQQISSLQAFLEVQQDENLKHQEREEELEGECAVLSAEVKTARRENESLQNNISKQQELEKELKSKCSLLAEKLDAVSDYQEMLLKRNELQLTCRAHETQLACIQEDVSRLRHENQNLLQENRTINASFREVTERLQHLHDLEKRYKALKESYDNLQEKEKPIAQSTRSTQCSVSVSGDCDQTTAKLLKDSTSVSQKDLTSLHDQIKSLQEDNRFLHNKIKVLEENCRSAKDRCEVIQERNKLLQEQSEAHNRRSEVLQVDLQFVKDNLKAAEAMNNSLLDQVQALEGSKGKSAELEKENMLLCDELAQVKEADSSLQADYKLLEDKCQALQDELQEATQSGQSLREQLHEQSMTLEHVISEMREEGSVVCTDLENDSMERKQNPEKEGASQQRKPQSFDHRTEVEKDITVRQQLSRLEQVLAEKNDVIADLKEQMTVLSLQQAAVGSPPAQRESFRDLEQEVQDLREEVMEKEGIIQELQEQHQSLKQSQVDLRRKVKEDSDLEQEVSILHQALFEKEKLIQELKETSKLLQLSHQEKTQSVREHDSGSKGPTPCTDRQERMVCEQDIKSQMLTVDCQRKNTDTVSSRSAESTDSIAISSDPDSDIMPAQDMDIVKEMGRLRKDIKKTKAVYANESALFQEALEREPVSQLGLRNSRSPSLSVDVSEMTMNDIPDDPEQLKKIVVKLLEENKCLTTENLRLQLRIREQEALVVEMEGRLQNLKHPPDDWQSLFERQLLLLQKQRDELQHLICERDAGVGLLSTRIGKEGIEAATLQQQQEDLTVKIGELEHCHRLLQQRQAELAHCQSEKRHLEQILLLKDETERQLMRQKRLLEEELATIESKLQEREATLVDEKTRLLKELKEKELHIFHLQSSQFSQQEQHSSQRRQPVLMGDPQSASTPRLSSKFQSAQAYFFQPLNSQEQDPSVLHKLEEGAKGGSFVEEPGADFHAVVTDIKSSSFPSEEAKHKSESHPVQGWLMGRRHSTGTAGFGRLSPSVNPIPTEPDEVYMFHKEAVDRLREKLRLQTEEETAQLSEEQASAISGYWERHNKQQP